MKANSLLLLSIFVAMLFSIIPLPLSLHWARPEWTLMVLIYWTLAMPERCGIVFASFVGLIQDSLLASSLGTHMLCYGMSIALVLFLYKRLRMFGIWKQAVCVLLLVAISLLIKSWIDWLTSEASFYLGFVWRVFVSALLWPWLLVFLRGTRRQFGIVNNIA